MPETAPRTAAEAVHDSLNCVAEQLDRIAGDLPVEVVQARMAVAQVMASCALVHAVRELTDEVRKIATPAVGTPDQPNGEQR